MPARAAGLAVPDRRRSGPLGAEGCGYESACADLDRLKMRRLWRRGALQGQRITRSEKRGGHTTRPKAWVFQASQNLRSGVRLTRWCSTW